MTTIEITAGLLACLILILYSGSRLSFYADKISGHTRLARTLIGITLLATVTSLPELVTGVVSVTAVSAPDIALGSILGSAVVNILILALIDPVSKTGPLLSRADASHILAAGFGIIMMGVIALGLISGARLPSIGHLGLYSPLTLLLYFAAIRFTSVYLKNHSAATSSPAVEEERKQRVSNLILHYAKHSLLVILAACALPFLGDSLADSAGMNQTFVGSIFVAVITSSPELIVSIAAIRMNAIDLAVGNLLGSNIFNILIIAIADVFYTAGPILEHVNPSHLLTAVFSFIMSAVIILALVVRTEYRRFNFSVSSLIILFIYATYLALLYFTGKN